MFDRFTDQLDAIDVFLIAAKTVMQIANAILDMFAQFTVIGDEAADGVFAYVEGIISETVAVVRAGDTTDWRIAMKCALYCRLQATSAGFGDTRAVILDGWRSDILALSPIPIGVAFASFIDSIKLETFQLRARIANNNVGECDDCEGCADTDWCVLYDFTVDSYGSVWASDPQDGSGWGASWVAGVGWQNASTAMAFSAIFPTGSHVTEVWLDCTDDGAVFEQHSGVNYYDSIVVDNLFDVGEGPMTVDYLLSAPGKVIIARGGGHSPNVRKARFKGQGVRPPGGVNC